MKKLHPADAANLQGIAEAVDFTAHMRLGPFDKITERAATLAEAASIAGNLETKHPGRKAIVYAVTAAGTSHFVPLEMRAAALKSETKDEAMETNALTAIQIAKLTAVVTGGGFKRAANRDAAAKRFIKVATEAGIAAPEGFLDMDFDAASADLRIKLDVLRNGPKKVASKRKAALDIHAASNALIANAVARDPELAAMVKADPKKVTKAKKPAAEKATAGRSSTALDAVIVSVAENPKKPGSRAHAVFSNYRAGQTVAEFIAAVVAAGFDEKQARADLSWDRRKGFITIK